MSDHEHRQVRVKGYRLYMIWSFPLIQADDDVDDDRSKGWLFPSSHLITHHPVRHLFFSFTLSSSLPISYVIWRRRAGCISILLVAVDRLFSFFSFDTPSLSNLEAIGVDTHKVELHGQRGYFLEFLSHLLPFLPDPPPLRSIWLIGLGGLKSQKYILMKFNLFFGSAKTSLGKGGAPKFKKSHKLYFFFLPKTQTTNAAVPLMIHD